MGLMLEAHWSRLGDGRGMGGMYWADWALVYGLIIFAPWMLLAIRCPACLRRPMWRLVSTEDANRWLVVLMHTPVCPLCGDTGEPTHRPNALLGVYTGDERS
jgi:hypothetical protein